MDLLDLLLEDGFKPLRKTVNEWASPCPWCPDHGRDRFIIRRTGSVLRFWCRRCGRRGAAYTYLVEFRQLAPEAARRILGVSEQEMRRLQGDSSHPNSRSNSDARRRPPLIWREKAWLTVLACERELWSGSQKTEDVLHWLRDERGLSDETIKEFRLGYVARTVFRERESWGLSDSREVRE